WPLANIAMIEPNFAKQRKLNEVATAINAEVFLDLLGARDGDEVHFHVMETGSSIMRENSEVARTVETRRLSTLDSLHLNLVPPILLKVDAQGYEIEILKGASETLPCLEAILLEVATLKVNQGAPL